MFSLTPYSGDFTPYVGNCTAIALPAEGQVDKYQANSSLSLLELPFVQQAAACALGFVIDKVISSTSSFLSTMMTAGRKVDRALTFPSAAAVDVRPLETMVAEYEREANHLLKLMDQQIEEIQNMYQRMQAISQSASKQADQLKHLDAQIGATINKEIEVEFRKNKLVYPSFNFYDPVWPTKQKIYMEYYTRFSNQLKELNALEKDKFQECKTLHDGFEQNLADFRQLAEKIEQAQTDVTPFEAQATKTNAIQRQISQELGRQFSHLIEKYPIEKHINVDHLNHDELVNEIYRLHNDVRNWYATHSLEEMLKSR